jgi:CHAT domain-containing protein
VPATTHHADSSFKLLAVAEPQAPKASYIPDTLMELVHIRRHLGSRDHATLESNDATKERVVKGMKECNWAHFACHGVQKPLEPTKSEPLLHDTPLALEEIVQLNLPKAEFAFLSACQTITGDDSLSEEAAHIAGKFLLAGYRSVVATMWSIKDSIAPNVTDEFYARIMQGNSRPDSRNAAEALHFSVQKLRQDNTVAFASWVPFVHVGI